MTNQNSPVQSMRVLRPSEYSGTIHGDYGYEVNSVRSENGYATRAAATAAMWRRVERMEREASRAEAR